MNDSQYAAFAHSLGAYQPLEWEQIPDLGLYMDQVVTFLERQCKGLYQEGERIFTPAMVNNYVKQGLVDRPVGKKYGREQLAQLLMICVLKQAASAEGMKALLKPEAGQSLRDLYAHFCEMQTQVLGSLAGEAPLPSPMASAVRCAAFRFLCNGVLSKGEDNVRPASKEEKAP